MQIARYFDVIYNGLSIALLLALAIALIRGLLLARRDSAADTAHGRGVALVAFGTALALSGGLVADGFLKSSPWFQQVRFGFYFVGFGLLVVGTMMVIRAAASGRSRRWRTLPFALLGLFVASLAVSVPLVTIRSTFVLNQYQEQVQVPVYWLPMLVPTAAGAIALFVVAVGAARRSRARAVCVGVFEALIFIGLLRESELLPDLGDPLVNLLVSFVPFVIGGIVLAVGAGIRSKA
jgi:hypothetical protein